MFRFPIGSFGYDMGGYNYYNPIFYSMKMNLSKDVFHIWSCYGNEQLQLIYNLVVTFITVINNYVVTWYHLCSVNA